MKTVTPLLALLLLSTPADASDLTKVDRKIRVEPTYQSKSPKYCLLALGADAKTKVWLVQDGDTLYADLNGNGDLTEPGERFKMKHEEATYRTFDVGEFKLDGLTYSGFGFTQMKAAPETVGNPDEWERLKRSSPDAWMWMMAITAERPGDDFRPLPKKISYIINGDGNGMLLFADKPQDAPLIHINGPWTLALQDRKQRLIPGHSKMLQIGVGTQGVGPGTFAWVLYDKTIPDNVYPEVEITYPTKSAGEEPIRRKYTLKQRC
jgi:hypothetical protein